MMNKFLLSMLLVFCAVTSSYAEARDRNAGNNARVIKKRNNNNNQRNNVSRSTVPRRNTSSSVDGYRPRRDGRVTPGRSGGINVPRTTPRTPPRVTPRTTPRTQPRVTPRTTPRTPPRVTPRTTPRTPPRVTPRTTPRTPPRVTPRTTPRTHVDNHSGHRANRQWQRNSWRRYQQRNTYHQRHGHRPNWHRQGQRFNRHHHVPFRNIHNHQRRYSHARYYHRTVPYKYIYWGSWVRWMLNSEDGYRYYNNYPYFVYNGYLHRYSSFDSCNYDLVDGRNNQVITDFSGRCSTAYDRCSDLRDDYNFSERGYRYFCAESFNYEGDYNYDWDYSNSFYSDVNDYNEFSIGDEFYSLDF